MPPYQVRGGLLKSGMTEKAVYGQTLFNHFGLYSPRLAAKEIVGFGS
jgi:hypothetical protein